MVQMSMLMHAIRGKFMFAAIWMSIMLALGIMVIIISKSNKINDRMVSEIGSKSAGLNLKVMKICGYLMVMGSILGFLLSLL